MDMLTLKDIVDTGSSGFLIYLILRLMARIESITDRILDAQEQAAAERRVIARESGLSTDDLTLQAHAVRLKNQIHERG